MYIKNSKLRIRTVKLDPTVADRIRRTLQKKPAIYPTPVPVMSTALSSNGITSREKGNIFSGKLPKLFMYGIIKNSAFTGLYTLNHFHYHNLVTTETRIYIDGEQIIPTIDTDFTNKKYNEAFLQILKATNDKSCLLNAHTWDVQNIWGFDLTPKGSNELTE